MDYYGTLILLAIMKSLVLIVNVISNGNFDKETKKGFIITFTFIIVGAICEWIGVVCDGKIFFENKRLDIGIHYVIKFIEFTIAPVMPVVFSKMIFESKMNKNKGSWEIAFWLILYNIIQLVSVFGKKLIFYVDDNNKYWHAEFYWIYILAFCVSSIYMIINIFEFSKEYQNKNKIQLNSIIVFLCVGVSIQLVNPKIKTCWLSIAIAASLFFIYYTSIIQYVDGLTKLLNQKCYYTYLEQSVDTMFTLLILDVNNFKYINDNFGHNFGDQILANLGEIIKKEYGEYGRCYRIGGDEFAVLIEKNSEKINRANGKFKKAVKEMRKEIPEFPSVSFGMSTYNPDSKGVHDISATVEEADARMYKMKNEVKNMANKQ